MKCDGDKYDKDDLRVSVLGAEGAMSGKALVRRPDRVGGGKALLAEGTAVAKGLR